MGINTDTNHPVGISYLKLFILYLGIEKGATVVNMKYLVVLSAIAMAMASAHANPGYAAQAYAAPEYSAQVWAGPAPRVHPAPQVIKSVHASLAPAAIVKTVVPAPAPVAYSKTLVAQPLLWSASSSYGSKGYY